MKVVKNPNNFNLDIITEKTIAELNSKCPFCDNTKIKGYYTNKYFGTLLFGPSKLFRYYDEDSIIIKIINLFMKLLHLNKLIYRRYKVLVFSCDECEGRWESDPFPANQKFVFDFGPYKEQMKNTKLYGGIKKELCKDCILRSECKKHKMACKNDYLVCSKKYTIQTIGSELDKYEG